MSKKGLFKRALVSLAIFAFGASCGLGCYKPLPQNEMQEANPVFTSTEPCPDSFDDLSYEEVIELVQTPEDVSKYLDWASQERIQGHPFYFDEYTTNGFRTNSFRRFHETHSTEVYDCSEIALGTLAMLSDNGYPAYFLNMSNSDAAHAAPVFKKDGKFCAISPSPDEYDSIDELVHAWGYTQWMLIDLNQQILKDWISGNGNYFNRFGSFQTDYLYFLRE